CTAHATSVFYTLPLHDALPICSGPHRSFGSVPTVPAFHRGGKGVFGSIRSWNERFLQIRRFSGCGSADRCPCRSTARRCSPRISPFPHRFLLACAKTGKICLVRSAPPGRAPFTHPNRPTPTTGHTRTNRL